MPRTIKSGLVGTINFDDVPMDIEMTITEISHEACMVGEQPRVTLTGYLVKYEPHEEVKINITVNEGYDFSVGDKIRLRDRTLAGYTDSIAEETVVPTVPWNTLLQQLKENNDE
jgi:hypothetical protein